MHEFTQMKLKELIAAAFNKRQRPDKAVAELAPDTCEYQDAAIFNGKDWQDISVDLLRQHSDAVYGFSPEAFCYYLPGIMTACIQGGNVRLACVDALINSLNRSPNPDYWDDFFVKRWTLLSDDELGALQQWTLWLLEVDPAYFEEGGLDRVMDTLDLLLKR
jgi:hypothetical protein